MSSPGAHQRVAVHEETIGFDLRYRVDDLVRIPGKMGLTWLEWVGEINDLHVSRI